MFIFQQLCWSIERLNHRNEWELCTWFVLSTSQIYSTCFDVIFMLNHGHCTDYIPNFREQCKKTCYTLLLKLIENCLACPFFSYVFSIMKISFGFVCIRSAFSAIVINLSIDIACWVSLAIWMVWRKCTFCSSFVLCIFGRFQFFSRRLSTLMSNMW